MNEKTNEEMGRVNADSGTDSKYDRMYAQSVRNNSSSNGNESKRKKQ